MYCYGCGSSIVSGAEYCGICGASVRAGQEAIAAAGATARLQGAGGEHASVAGAPATTREHLATIARLGHSPRRGWPRLAAALVILALVGAGGYLLGEQRAAGWSVDLSADSSSAQLAGLVTLTAHANRDVGPTPYDIEIVDQRSGQTVGSCGHGTTCTARVARYAAESDSFVARVNAMPVSRPVTVNWSGSWSVSLSANHTEVGDNSQVRLTAQANNPVDDSPYSITILDQSTGQAVATCTVGSACTGTVSESSAGSSTYVAAIESQSGGTTQTQSNPLSITWDNWSISLSADQTQVQTSAMVTLTAQTNDDVGPSPYSIHIINLTTGAVVSDCSQGVTCSARVASDDVANNYYIARVSDQATSGAEEVTWGSPSGQFLGGLGNLPGYCQSVGYQDSSLDGSTAGDWHCVDSSGNRHNLDMTAACRWQYNQQNAVATLGDYNNPDSWQCED